MVEIKDWNYVEVTPGASDSWRWVKVKLEASDYPIKSVEEMKESNPKDLVGVKKVSYSVIPETVIAEIAVAMMEGARKYARHNYRVAGVKASVYFDAARRHLAKWWEGQDIDPDSGVHEITKAIASLVVLRDAMIQGKYSDDRPPKASEGWMNDIQKQVNELFEKYPESLKPYTEIENA